MAPSLLLVVVSYATLTLSNASDSAVSSNVTAPFACTSSVLTQQLLLLLTVRQLRTHKRLCTTSKKMSVTGGQYHPNMKNL